MPMVQFNHAKGALTDAQKAALAEKLTGVLLKIEGGADTPGGRGIAWVLFNEIDAAAWAIGGKFDNTYVAPAGKYLVYVTVPEGSMDQTRKTAVHKAVNDVILEVTENKETSGAGRSAWVIINEITEGHWGVSGHTASINGIATIVGIDHASDQFKFTRDYFSAKRRAFSGADYPADSAGLLRQSQQQ